MMHRLPQRECMLFQGCVHLWCGSSGWRVLIEVFPNACEGGMVVTVVVTTVTRIHECHSRGSEWHSDPRLSPLLQLNSVFLSVTEHYTLVWYIWVHTTRAWSAVCLSTTVTLYTTTESYEPKSNLQAFNITQDHDWIQSCLRVILRL